MKLRIILQVCLTGTGKFTAQAESNHHLGVSALQMDSGDLVTRFTQGLILSLPVSTRERKYSTLGNLLSKVFLPSPAMYTAVLSFP